jgi:nitrogen-specific signal transduction histidine kinase
VITVYALLTLAVSILSFFLGLFVIIINRKSQLNLIWFFLCLTIAGWNFGYYITMIPGISYQTALICSRLSHASGALISSLFFTFTLIFLDLMQKKSFQLYLCHITTSFIALLCITSFVVIKLEPKLFMPYYPVGKLGYIIYIFNFLFWVLSAHYLYISMYKSLTGKQQAQVKYFILGTSIGFFGGSNCFPLIFGYPVVPIASILIIVYPFTTAYAILKHRLLDIEIVIKKGIIFSVLMAFIIGIYSFLIFLGQNTFQSTLGINQWLATIITAFIIAIGYKPLEDHITDITNHYFFRKKYDYQRTLMQSSEAMNLLTDIDRLVKLTTRIVARRMDLEETTTLVYDEINHKYVVRAAEGKSKDLLGQTFTDNHELFKHLFNSKQILIKDEVVNTMNSKFLMPDEKKRLTTIKKEMEKLHAQICVPSITRGKYMGNKLVAVFCLGEKKSGDMYSNEDIQLLSTLSNQAAVAVENAIMYSDLMRQFQELKLTKDQLVQSEKLAALGTMAAGIAHEIRNPLTSLQLFVEMMAVRFDDHEFRAKFTQIVPPEVERLNRIVNDLVSFAKPSKLTMEPAQINEILDKTVRLSEISFKKMNVKTIKEFGSVPMVPVDQQKIMQIFLNLLMNGSQAMPNGGTLTVRTYYDEIHKKVCVDVKDTGVGISEENMKKLFAPFFTTKEGGTGLGLAITKRIIDEHKGEIKIHSKLGEGTTFTVEFPVVS